MKLGVMQPYLFPYIGYFQLVHAVDKFIFYDDVNYIKSGWINRNMIQIKGEKKFITLNLIKASSYKPINEIKVGEKTDKVFKTIKQSYAKAPFLNETLPIIEKVFKTINSESFISKIAGLSIIEVAKYLKLDTQFEYSSEKYPKKDKMNRTERLIKICKRNNAEIYINPIGGKELYSKNDFAKNNVSLYFLNCKIAKYQQFSSEFIPNLSIIDVMMFNPLDLIYKMLEIYELE